LQLWSDFLQIQAKKPLKQRLVFSEKNALQLWSDLLKFQAEKSLKQRLNFSDKKRDCNYGQISFKFKQKFIETTVGFL